MTSLGRMPIRLLVISDSRDALGSHWPYSTASVHVVARVNTDAPDFLEEVKKTTKKLKPHVFAFSGKNSAVTASAIRVMWRKLWERREDQAFRDAYSDVLEVVRIQNTNLQRYSLPSGTPSSLAALKRVENSWLQAAIAYPFDVILVQTTGDAPVLNRAIGRDVAVDFPYTYNDRWYRAQDCDETVDIGMYFKTERHEYRMDFVRKVLELARRRGWRAEFSDEYWGEPYAEAIARTKVILHLSRFGDVPHRLYEAAGSGKVLLTDALGYGIESLFTEGEHYLVFERDLSDLEEKLAELLERDELRHTLGTAAARHAKSTHSWGVAAEHSLYDILTVALERRTSHLREET